MSLESEGNLIVGGKEAYQKSTLVTWEGRRVLIR